MTAALVLLVIAAAIAAGSLASRWAPPVAGATLALTVEKPENGTIVGDEIRCGSQGSDCYAEIGKGELVALDLEADAGFEPTAYTHDCASNRGRMRMSQARRCGAKFSAVSAAVEEKPRSELTLIVHGGGDVQAASETCRSTASGKTCHLMFSADEKVNLEVLSAKGFEFKGFTGACDIDGIVTMSGPQTCGVNFAPSSGTMPAPPPARAGRAGQGVDSPRASAGKGGAGAANASGSAATQAGSGASGAQAAGTGGGSAVSTEASKEGQVGPPPPPAAPDPDVVAKKDHARVLEAYRRAYEALDPVAVQRVYPDFRSPEQFKPLESLKLTYAGEPKYIDLDSELGTAKVELEINYESKRKQGGVDKYSRKHLFDLNKRTRDNTWSIGRVALAK